MKFAQGLDKTFLNESLVSVLKAGMQLPFVLVGVPFLIIYFISGFVTGCMSYIVELIDDMFVKEDSDDADPA